MAAISEAQATVPDAMRGRHIVLHDVPWSTYVVLRDSLDERGSHVRMTYLDGVLELTSPGRTHEVATRIIARLIDAWADVNDVDLRGYRSMTFRDENEEVGFEPDECFKVGEMPHGGIPDFTIEITVSSALVDRMTVFARHGIPEVWEWDQRAMSLTVHRLVGGAYVTQPRSAILPALDLVQLAGFVRFGENQIKLIRAYRAAISGA